MHMSEVKMVKRIKLEAGNEAYGEVNLKELGRSLTRSVALNY